MAEILQCLKFELRLIWVILMELTTTTRTSHIVVDRESRVITVNRR